MLLETLEFFLRQILCVEHAVISCLDGKDQLIQFHLHRFAIAILCILNEEDHQKGDDRGTRINNQLPRITKVKDRPSNSPNDNNKHGYEERQGMSKFA